MTTTNSQSAITSQQIRHRLVLCLICLSLVGASFLYAPWSTTGPVLCPFRFIVGMPCPGCGLTRSFCALSQGDIRDAFAYHIFGPVLFAACLCAVPVLLVEMFRRRRFERIQQLVFSHRGAIVAAWCLGIYHALRLLGMFISGEVVPAIRGSAIGAFLSSLGIIG